MAENQQVWKRTEYETWDEAFRGLAPVIRQQSVRVAAYTQVLYVQACADKFGAETKEGADRMQGKYADLAYKCGMYHQLGKALVPPDYQVWTPDFTGEEQNLYRKYTTDGRALVTRLLTLGEQTQQRRKADQADLLAKNIPSLMLQESCEQHMERWDGSGYPAGIMAEKISPIAQIVGLAKELDRLCSETKSENPFQGAMQILLQQSGTAWNPALLAVLQNCRPKCRAVYNKYIHYTMTLPKTIPLVEKRKDRPMGLSYRPMASDTEGTIVAYEAIPWFGGVLGKPNETESMAELEGMFLRKQMVEDVSKYFLYEAADTLLRIENCKLQIQAVVLQMLPSFYQLNTQLQNFIQLFKDQPVDRDKLLFTVPADVVADANKRVTELIERYLRNGVRLVLDGYNPEKHGQKLTPTHIKGMGFQYVRLASELSLLPETANHIQALRQDGFTVLGGGADSHEILTWLANCGVAYMSGTVTGVPVNEDELIRDCLARER